MVDNPRLPEFDESSPLRPAGSSHIVLRSARYPEMVDGYKTFLNAEPLPAHEIFDRTYPVPAESA